jgi:hypothetical protein
LAGLIDATFLIGVVLPCCSRSPSLRYLIFVRLFLQPSAWRIAVNINATPPACFCDLGVVHDEPVWPPITKALDERAQKK